MRLPVAFEDVHCGQESNPGDRGCNLVHSSQRLHRCSLIVLALAVCKSRGIRVCDTHTNTQLYTVIQMTNFENKTKYILEYSIYCSKLIF